MQDWRPEMQDWRPAMQDWRPAMQDWRPAILYLTQSLLDQSSQSIKKSTINA